MRREDEQHLGSVTDITTKKALRIRTGTIVFCVSVAASSTIIANGDSDLSTDLAFYSFLLGCAGALFGTILVAIGLAEE